MNTSNLITVIEPSNLWCKFDQTDPDEPILCRVQSSWSKI